MSEHKGVFGALLQIDKEKKYHIDVGLKFSAKHIKG
jgi:hypothetical protein